MNICIFGTFSGNLDEGYKNIAFNLSKNLSRRHNVLNVNIKDIYSLDSWRKIREFKPEILHYLTAPTFSSFIILKIANILYGKDAKLIISSLNPHCLKLFKNPFLKNIVSLMMVDLILTQCTEVKKIVEDIGCSTVFIPNGVDINRFIPVSKKRKDELREKYNIDKKKFVVLHVGHIRESRGIRLFTKIQNEDNNQIIMIGSSYFKTDDTLYRDLVDNGCLIYKRYFENIEEIYALADCYIYPTPVENSIFMPLSVLEAMSCNLPVLSTRCSGLSDNFEEGDSLFFFDSEIGLYKKLKMVKNASVESKNREKVLSYSWDTICERLENVYRYE